MSTTCKTIALVFLSLHCIMAAFAQTAFDTTKWELRIMNGDSILFKKPSAADKARDAGDLEAAIPFYKQEMAELPDEFLPYNLACAYSLLGHNDSAFHYLDVALSKDSSIHVLTDPDMYNLLSDPRWKKLETRQTGCYQAKNGKLKDLALAQELWQMKLKDQAYYYAIQIAEKKNGMKSPEKDSLWQLKRVLNDANIKRLEALIARKGWPRMSVVGRDAATAAFLIVQHGDLALQKKYKPQIEAAANKKDAEWSSLALLIDRIEVNENRPQIYGSQVKYNEEKKVYEPFPIVDESNLDIRRRKVGLRPAKDYYANWQIDYTVQQNTN